MSSALPIVWTLRSATIIGSLPRSAGNNGDVQVETQDENLSDGEPDSLDLCEFFPSGLVVGGHSKLLYELKPTKEFWTKDRTKWVDDIEGATQQTMHNEKRCAKIDRTAIIHCSE